MNALIVYAHHEPSSFAAAMLHTVIDTLQASGHTVTVSDLYAMGFDPVSDRRNFRTVFDTTRLRQQAEEAHAAQIDGFAPPLSDEMRKLAECDLLAFVFPIWWLGLPAILKGWVDRVFAAGVAYGGGRHFGNGVMRGKRAMCIVSTGGFTTDFHDSGHYAPIGTVLYPVHRGIFEFTGFEVLPPFVAHGPHRVTQEERSRMLGALRERVSQIAVAAGTRGHAPTAR
ncbi:MAG TPA: NAD(P)H-dependent oxidoreductase [Burkholderiaceae bacterium]|nr:NAD(P)H-dependent oxidoreductase [Burkholderiaceae bacterium]